MKKALLTVVMLSLSFNKLVVSADIMWQLNPKLADMIVRKE